MPVRISRRLGDRGGWGVIRRVGKVDGDVFNDGRSPFGMEMRSGRGFADVEAPCQEGVVDELDRKR